MNGHDDLPNRTVTCLDRDQILLVIEAVSKVIGISVKDIQKISLMKATIRKLILKLIVIIGTSQCIFSPENELLLIKIWSKISDVIIRMIGVVPSPLGSDASFIRLEEEDECKHVFAALFHLTEQICSFTSKFVIFNC